MRLFISELQYIDELYQSLRQEFARPPDETWTGEAFLVNTVLRNEELLCRIGSLSDRVAQFAEEWKSYRERVAPQMRAQVESLASKVRADAEDLLRVCIGNSRRLTTSLERARREVRQLQTGFRYLDSVKPARTNYPKFVDSVG